MLPKPDTCKGCPMYGTGVGYVPDSLVPGSRVFILMQNPGETEVQRGIPACGTTGEKMNGTFIPLSGLYRSTRPGDEPGHNTVSVGNVLKCRWHDLDGKETNELPPPAILEAATQHCTSHHLQIPESVEIVVSQGKLAFDYITDGALEESDGKPSKMSDWRGSFLPITYEGRLVFQVVHIADFHHDPKQQWIAERDWTKLGRHLEYGDQHLEPPPRITVSSIEGWKVGYDWIQQAIADGQPIVVDTEYIPDTKYLTIVGLGYRHANGTITGLQVDVRERDGHLRGQLAWQLRQLVKHNTVVMHNAIADIMVLDDNLSIKYRDYHAIQDTMLAHAALWGELPHKLDFCASIYSPFQRLKHLARTDVLLYNWGDIIATLAVYEALQEEMRYDHGAQAVYQNQLLRLIPILAGAKKRGIKVNTRRVLDAEPALARGMDLATRIATVGSRRKAFNLGSGHQLKDWCYRVHDYPVQKDKDTKRPTTDDDAIGVLREHVGPAFDPKEELTVDIAMDRIIDGGADPVLEARVLYVQTEHILNNYFFPLVKEIANAKSETERKHRRNLYRSRIWRTEDLLVRVFPDITTHTQKSGRHSTSDPPLAQLPARYRDIIRPDKGRVWLKWDWSAIEPRILEALCGSTILRRSFDEGIDLHTWTVCTVFGYPFPPDLINPHKCKCVEYCEHKQWRDGVKWQGKDDPRRVFAKSGRYEVWYGGTGSNAAAAASRFGLDKKLLKAAVQKLASSDPQYYQWRCETEAEVKRARVIRSWDGRPRRFLGQGSGVVREALNHPMQAGVSGIYNLTIIEIAEKYQMAEYVFGMHDSQVWSFQIELLTKEIFQGIRVIVEQPRNIQGAIRTFPADFELVDEWTNYYGKSHDLSIDDWFAGQRYNKMCGCVGCTDRIYIGSEHES